MTVVAPPSRFPSQNQPEPWISSSTNTQFLGEFLSQLWQWVELHSAILSAVIGGVGMILVGVTWVEFQTALNQAGNQVVVRAESIAPSPASPSAALAPAGLKIRAHIAGAVRKPGVYELSSTSVVQDLVTQAGGLSGLVWQDYLDEYINLAAPLSPNQKVWIPTQVQRELLEQSTHQGASVGSGASTTDMVSNVGSLMSVNAATVAELDTLPDIGQKRAEDIVANRPYSAIEELTSKAGVPASIVAKLKNQLTL